MDFPAKPEEQAVAPESLVEALGASPKYVGRNAFDYIVELESEEAVRALKPNLALLGTIPDRGLIVTSRAADYDFVSRFFAPASGVDEDPVTMPVASRSPQLNAKALNNDFRKSCKRTSSRSS